MKPLLFALLLVTALPFANAADTSPPQPITHQVQKWEYATLQLGQAPTWQSGNGYIHGKLDIGEVAIPEFRAKLASAGILGPIDSSAMVFAELWTAIGDKGWELVAVVDDGRVATYYFKRPKN